MKNNRFKNAFTLIEIILVIAIMSIVLLGSVALVAPKKIKKPQTPFKPHGTFECYWEGDQLMQFTADNENNRQGTTVAVEGDHCTFTPPRADFFTLQVIGAGQDGHNTNKFYTFKNVIETKQDTLAWKKIGNLLENNLYKDTLLDQIRSLELDDWVFDYWNYQFDENLNPNNAGGFININLYPKVLPGGAAICKVIRDIESCTPELYDETLLYPAQNEMDHDDVNTAEKDIVKYCEYTDEYISANGGNSGTGQIYRMLNTKFYLDGEGNNTGYSFSGIKNRYYSEGQNVINSISFLLASEVNGDKKSEVILTDATQGGDGSIVGLKAYNGTDGSGSVLLSYDFTFDNTGDIINLDSNPIETPFYNIVRNGIFFMFRGGRCYEKDFTNIVPGQPNINDNTFNTTSNTPDTENEEIFGNDYETAKKFYHGTVEIEPLIIVSRLLGNDIEGHYGNAGTPGNYASVVVPDLNPDNTLNLYPQKTRINEDNEATECSKIEETIGEDVIVKLQCSNLELTDGGDNTIEIKPIKESISEDTIYNYIAENVADIQAQSFNQYMSYYISSVVSQKRPGEAGAGGYNIISGLDNVSRLQIGHGTLGNINYRNVKDENYTNKDQTEEIKNSNCLSNTQPIEHPSNPSQLYCSAGEGKPGAVVIIW